MRPVLGRKGLDDHFELRVKVASCVHTRRIMAALLAKPAAASPIAPTILRRSHEDYRLTASADNLRSSWGNDLPAVQISHPASPRFRSSDVEVDVVDVAAVVIVVLVVW